jgi:5'/3'-nucleotidase
MRILLTNDDGIHAPGLKVMKDIADELSDDVWIVAPETNQSGVSHSLTLHDPLRIRHIGKREMAISGTPTDCVLMGVLELLKDKKPNLVLSGVNQGQNAGDDATYSGTVAGAMEGTLLGIPSIALSQSRHGRGYDGEGAMRWETAREHGPSSIKKLLEAGWPEKVLLNLNFPDCAPDEVKGLAVTNQGYSDPNTSVGYERREDMRGDPYYWLRFRRNTNNPPKGSDVEAIHDNTISVTPLHLDLTHYETCQALHNSLKD